MPILAPDVCTESTSAKRTARQCWEANYYALRRTQPAVAEVLNEVQLDHEWVFARDGSISALENGCWWAGCSVPLLAGRTLLRTLADEPVGSCQLAPAHAGLVRAARERMGNCPVLFVAQPDVRAARMILSSHDFSEQIDRRRFWIVSGPAWLAHFEQIFTDNPGLATPLRFIRTRLTAEEITLPMITEIQAVFSRVLAARGNMIASFRSEPAVAVDSKKILLVGGSEFRLWDFGTRVIEQQLNACAQSGQLTIDRFDMDDALSGSPLAILQAARGCGSIVAADVCRADCNQLISPEIPWITWMTQPGAPPFDTAGPKDALILADEKWKPIARVAGWPAARIRVCGWPLSSTAIQTPALRYPEEPGRSAKTPGSSEYLRAGVNGVTKLSGELGFICDTRKIEIPTSVADFSSHRLLWELIEEELAGNPLAVEDVEAYLSNRAGQLNIATDVLDRPRFIEELILPAYQQGLVRLLISAGVSIRLWGKGWGGLPEFTPRVGGMISSWGEFDQAVSACAGLVYCWPTRAAHPMEMISKPVVHRAGMDRSGLVREARKVIAGERRAAAGGGGNELGRVLMELASCP